MPLVYLPEHDAFFLWGKPAPRALPWLAGGDASRIDLVLPEGRRAIDGRTLPLLDTMARLAVVPAATLEAVPGSIATWILASKLALELVSRECVVPTIVRRDGSVEARWTAALSGSEDAARVAALARSMPPAAHAVPISAAAPRDIWAPDALLRAYLDGVADALVRLARGGPEVPASREASTRSATRSSRTVVGSAPAPGSEPGAWQERWRSALTGPARTFEASDFAERSLVEDLERWSRPATWGRDRLRACFRLELPEADRDPFMLRFLLQSLDDPSLLIPASEVWRTAGRSLEALGRAFRDPQQSLIEALGRAARLFPPLERALGDAKPQALGLDPATAWSFLGTGAAALAGAGFGVIVPEELTTSGQCRLRLRMRVGAGSATVAGIVARAPSLRMAGLRMNELCVVDWEAMLGDAALTAREVLELARQKAPLVRYRGAWVAVDPGELAEFQQRIAGGPARMTMCEAMQAALAGEVQQGARSIAVAATGGLAALLDRLRHGGALTVTGEETGEISVPATLRATLRPYQVHGLAWLSAMAQLGFGACLADDMGLGKTLQLLAFLLWRASVAPDDRRPTLLVAPTSVVGNWEREAQRFAPSLPLIRHYGQHYGAGRVRHASRLPDPPGALIVTTYGRLRRDAELLAEIEWSAVVLDEAQNIKHAASRAARAARALRASHRFALTGTPVENRLVELWSILEFANPGLLGPLETFRREFAMPIERYGSEAAADRLRRVVGPFILRRLKDDPLILQDLPAKHEMKVICTLTREQASLYQAVVDAELTRVEAAIGIERRDRVLALLTSLKQICNHPAQFLSERGPLANRSGKLARLTEMLEEAVAAGDKAIVFTQFREMGDRLVAHLADRLGCEVIFLHGGTPKRARDEMVRRFQDDAHGPRVFVLSGKAGGTGFTLTAAGHVFHYDRWWNPADRDQPTDRAYRIGQRRAVAVHKLVSAGTIEDKIDQLLDQNRQLAARVVGAGEQWITELNNRELRELFALSREAIVLDGDDRNAGDDGNDADDGGGGGDEVVASIPARRRRTARVRRTELRP